MHRRSVHTFVATLGLLVAAAPCGCSGRTVGNSDAQRPSDAGPVDQPSPDPDQNILPRGDCGPASVTTQHRWASRLGREDRLKPLSLVRLDDGTVCQAGVFSGDAHFGHDQQLLRLEAVGDWNYYLVCQRSDGSALWAKRIQGGSEWSHAGLVADGAGNITLIADFLQSVDAGGGPLTAPSGKGAFLTSFDKTGTNRWSLVLDTAHTFSLAANSRGDVFVAGSTRGNMKIAGVSLNTDYGHAFVASLDKTGALRFGRPLGFFDGHIRALTASATGEVTFAGQVKMTLQLGNGLSAKGAFVAHLNALGAPQWSNPAPARALGVDCAGNISVASDFSGTIDLGSGPLKAQGSSDLLLASYTAAGALRWAKTFSSSEGGDQLVSSSSTSITGCKGATSILVTVGGPISFGGATLPGKKDAVAIATFDPAGKHLWSTLLASDRRDAALHVGGDTITARVWLDASKDLGGGPVSPAGYRHDLIASFDSAGKHLASFASSAWQTGSGEGWGLGSDAQGQTTWVGRLRTEIELGDHVLTGWGSPFLASIANDGSIGWARTLRGYFSAPPFFAQSADGTSVLAQRFAHRVDAGGGELKAPKKAHNFYIASYDAQGNHLWSKVFGSDELLNISHLAVGPRGAVIAGTIRGEVDFGGVALRTTYPHHLYLAAFDTRGEHRWSKVLKSSSVDGLVVDGEGNTTILGHLSGRTDFTGAPLKPAKKAGLFVGRFDPRGTPLWTRELAPFDISGAALDMALDGKNLVIAGTNDRRPLQQLTVVGLDAAGNHRFSRPLCSGTSVHTSALTIADDQTIYLAGSYGETVECDGRSLPFEAGSHSAQDAFVLALDAGGCLRWLEHLSSPANDRINAMSVRGDELLLTGESAATIDIGGRPERLSGGFLLSTKR